MKTWTIPGLIALLTTAGLIGGLVSDGVGDVLAWIGLIVPTLIGAVVLRRGAAAQPRRHASKHQNR